jgi:hypothetical protein
MIHLDPDADPIGRRRCHRREEIVNGSATICQAIDACRFRLA